MDGQNSVDNSDPGATNSQSGNVTLNTLLSGFPSDPGQLQSLLLQSMLVNQNMQKDNHEIQKKNQELMAQLVNNSHRMNEKKISNCPRKRKTTSLEAWIEEVKMWNDTHKNTSMLTSQKPAFGH